ncbi:MAG: DUF488 family protein [Gammaproteobacteria bacterium]|nr:DUF488 family protein [Gammaproteobacteria bacterium]
MALRVKRVYETPAGDDGLRILVDRLWPRGLSREKAALDHWFKEIAPSAELRRWFGHRPERWKEFHRRYFEELDRHPEQVAELRKAIGRHTATLLYAAHDEEYNNAQALREYLRS